MNKYFIFFDDKLINVVLVLLISLILTSVILLVCKKLFKFNCSPLIFFLFVIARLVIGEKIRSNDNIKFRNSAIHSLVVEQVEFNDHRFRNTLENGMVFFTEAEVSIGDSIVKKANSNTYQKYEKDYNGNYVFVKEYTY
jgi:hypothetical protein